MTQQEAKTVLLKAFSVLTEEQRENSRWHLRNETPVLCGPKSGDNGRFANLFHNYGVG